MTVGLSQNEQERINVFPVLLNVVNVHELNLNQTNDSYVRNPLRILAIKINILTCESIPLHVVKPHHTDKTVSGEAHTSEVVEDHELSGINSFPLVHNHLQYNKCHKIEDV